MVIRFISEACLWGGGGAVVGVGGQLPLCVVVQAEDDLHGDDDDGGALDVVPRQDRTGCGVECVERLIRHTGTLHQAADPRVELVWLTREEVK